MFFLNERFQVFDSTGTDPVGHDEMTVFDEKFSSRDNAIAWLSHAAIDSQKEHIYLFAENANFIEKPSKENQLKEFKERISLFRK